MAFEFGCEDSPLMMESVSFYGNNDIWQSIINANEVGLQREENRVFSLFKELSLLIGSVNTPFNISCNWLDTFGLQIILILNVNCYNCIEQVIGAIHPFTGETEKPNTIFPIKQILKGY